MMAFKKMFTVGLSAALAFSGLSVSAFADNAAAADTAQTTSGENTAETAATATENIAVKEGTYTHSGMLDGTTAGTNENGDGLSVSSAYDDGERNGMYSSHPELTKIEVDAANKVLHVEYVIKSGRTAFQKLALLNDTDADSAKEAAAIEATEFKGSDGETYKGFVFDLPFTAIGQKIPVCSYRTTSKGTGWLPSSKQVYITINNTQALQAALQKAVFTEDGTYEANAVLSSRTGISNMFKLAEEDQGKISITVKDGVATAQVRLNGSGYDYLYMGTPAEAVAAGLDKCAKGVETDKNGKSHLTYALPVTSIYATTDLAARSRSGGGKADAANATLVEVPDNNENNAMDGIYGFTDASGAVVKVWYPRTITITDINLVKDTPDTPDTPDQPAKPAKTSFKSVKSPKKKVVKLTWKKVTKNNKGYKIRYSGKSSMSGAKNVTVSNASTTTKTIKKLKSGKKYYFQIRTYGSAGSSAWSAKKSVKVK